jgi:hypothetical protein
MRPEERRSRAATEQERFVVRSLIEDALTTDGAHHKQWYLEQIARYLELPVTADHEPGVPP